MRQPTKREPPRQSSEERIRVFSKSHLFSPPSASTKGPFLAPPEPPAHRSVPVGLAH